jgi:hypothetical protein
MVARNVRMHVEPFGNLGGGHALVVFTREEVHGTPRGVAECRCDG